MLDQQSFGFGTDFARFPQRSGKTDFWKSRRMCPGTSVKHMGQPHVHLRSDGTPQRVGDEFFGSFVPGQQHEGVATVHGFKFYKIFLLRQWSAPLHFGGMAKGFQDTNDFAATPALQDVHDFGLRLLAVGKPIQDQTTCFGTKIVGRVMGRGFFFFVLRGRRVGWVVGLVVKIQLFGDHWVP